MEAYYNKQPLADRMRPQKLDEFVGQEHLVAKGKVLRGAIERKALPSMIFWGPPGSGNTTLPRIIAATTGTKFIPLSATSSGVKDVREAIDEARSIFSAGSAPLL